MPEPERPPFPSERDRVGERAAYAAVRPRVGDFLALGLWRRPAFLIVRAAARAGVPPAVVTLAGAVAGFVACLLWRGGWWWAGMVAALVYTLLDAVDGPLARLTGRESRAGALLDRGLALLLPPLWTWGWLSGLAARGHPIEPLLGYSLLVSVLAGGIARLAIERLFRRQFGFAIHGWRPVDTSFRLVTAGPGPDLAILIVALLFDRPDKGIQYVALWTLASLVFHAVRLAQANERRLRRSRLRSWLDR
ncbi:CDP-alcohol phosphatidyltransferase family protein [Sphingomonas sp. ASV193]|uniref:CDP-alcohol phosphatidyltransferase family protein n=1 Tax=Sphingomonas sp. ASV193 TaxID=3144405 RepID=UPI0032E8DED4